MWPPYLLEERKPSQTTHLQIDGKNLPIKKIKLLNPERMTVYRVTLEPNPKFSTVIVKQRKEEWENEFEAEKQTYKRLKPLQGDTIPVLLGECEFEGTPALILSEVDGSTLQHITRNDLDIKDEDIKQPLETALKTLYDHGAEYWDERLDNFILSNGKVVVLDLEQVEFPKEIGPWEPSVNCRSAGSLVRQFQYARDPNFDLNWLSAPLPRPPTPPESPFKEWESWEVRGLKLSDAK